MTKFSLHPDWRRILLHAWSMRLNFVTALLSGADAAMTYAVDGRVGATLAVFGVSLATSAARIVKQKKFADE